MNTDREGEQKEAPQEEAPRQLPIKKISELGSAVVNGQGRSMNSPGSVPRPEAVSNKVPLQASSDTNNGNKSRDKVSELDSRAMEDHCSTDGTTTHHAGMSMSVSFISIMILVMINNYWLYFDCASEHNIHVS